MKITISISQAEYEALATKVHQRKLANQFDPTQDPIDDVAAKALRAYGKAQRQQKEAGKRKQRKRQVVLVNEAGKVRGGSFKVPEEVLREAEILDE